MILVVKTYLRKDNMCDFKFPLKYEDESIEELLIPDVFEDENLDDWTW